MAACEERSAVADQGASSFAQRAEELFNKLANDEEVVSSEAAGLVVALAYLDLQVTEEKVVEATREILQPTENQFSKDAFLRFVEWLRPQPSATEGSLQPSLDESENPEPLGPTPVGGESSIIAKSGAEASCVEAGVRALWVFEPKVSTDTLDVDARVFAEQVYARVEQAMVSEINQAVDTDLQSFLSTMPRSLSEDAQRELRQGWLAQHYVKHVAAVVERCTKARWSFKPALALDQLSDEERPRAAQLYSSVDEAAAEKIDAMVASDFLQVASTLPVSVSSKLKDSLRMGWLQENYIKVVARVLEEAARNVAAKWTFSPMVTVESLPLGERAAATRMYAIVDFATATEIEAAVEFEFSSVAALLPASAQPDMKAELRSSWLLHNYTSIVSRVLNARSQTSAGCEGWTFTPAVSIEALPCQEKGRALKVYASVTREEEADILRVTEDSWSSYQSSLGFSMAPELAASLRQEWLAREYVDIVSSIVSASPMRSAGSAVAARPTASHTRGVRPLATAASAGTAEDVPTPKRKIRRRGSDMSTSVCQHKRSEMKVWCAADMHAPEAWQDDRWNIFTGAVIAADTAPREAGGGGKKVFNAVLEDSTGVISLVAWNQHADELASTLIQLEHANAEELDAELWANAQEPDAELWLRVELFSISHMKGSPGDLCPIGAMQTIPAANAKRNQAVAGSSRDADMVDAAFGTQFTIVRASEVHTPGASRSPSLRSSITGVSNFEVLGQLHPPFRVNIAGVVADVSELQPTVGGSGKLVRTLVLSDPNGCQVTIRQLGNAAEDVEVQRQRNVVAYFVSGSKAWKPGEAGSLWAYEDSFIKVGSTAKFVPSCIKEVAILAE